jgi:hypothetical protein
MQKMQESKQYVPQILNHDNKSCFMCKMAYAGIIIEKLKGMGIKNPFVNKTGRPLYNATCTFETCKGAHKMENLVSSYQVNQFMSISKAKFEWVKLYFALKKCIFDNFQKIIKEEFENLSKESIDKMNFLELISTWRNLASIHRSRNNWLEKENKAQIHPTFALPEDFEDFAWSFERITHYCSEYVAYQEKIRSGSTLDINDLCLGTGMNCKFGVSKRCELLCGEDFLNNKCDCPSKQTIKAMIEPHQISLVEAERELKELEDELEKAPVQLAVAKPVIPIRRSRYDFLDENDGDEKNEEVHPVRNKKVIEQLIYKQKQRIKIILNEIETLKESRMLHFSEFGLIGFNIQLKSYYDALEAEKRAAEEKQRQFDSMIENAKTVKAVVGLGKLGKKK